MLLHANVAGRRMLPVTACGQKAVIVKACSDRACGRLTYFGPRPGSPRQCVMVIRSSCPVFVTNAKSLRAGHTSRDVYTRGVGAVVSLPGLLVAPDAIPAYLPAEAGIARIWLPRILPVQTTRFSEVVSGCPSKAIPEPDEYPSTQRARPALPGSAVTDPRGQRWGS
jgi:hypothetical protein